MNIVDIIKEELNKLSEEDLNSNKLSNFNIKSSSDDIYEVGEANDLTISAKKENVPLMQLHGGVNLNDVNERKRIDKLKDIILSPDGYISTIIIDGDNNVIEGQHRFQALIELKFDYAPVVRLKGIDDYIKNRIDIDNTLKENGVLKSDYRNQLITMIAKIISDENGDVKQLKDYTPPQGFETAWNAAINKLI